MTTRVMMLLMWLMAGLCLQLNAQSHTQTIRGILLIQVRKVFFYQFKGGLHIPMSIAFIALSTPYL